MNLGTVGLVMVDKDAHGNEKSRREILELTGAAGAAGALGSLAGCLGSSGDDGGGGDNGSGGGDSGGDNGSGGGGGGSEAITIQFLSAGAAENSTATTAFQKSMKNYEEMRGNVTVDLQKASYGDVKSKLSSTVAAGNSPALAEAGSAGLSFYLDGEVPEHGQWIEATEGYPDQWTTTNKEVANFREEWWGGGAASGSARGVALRPKLVSQVGVSDPLTEMKTWSQMYDVVSRIDEQLDTIAWEETGEPVDLESYWGEARTAYSDGNDPWIRGDPTDPDVLMGNEPATDGMVKNTVKLAHRFSSDESAGRTDEEMASLLLTDRVAIEPHGFQSWAPFTSVKEDATFGWNDGNGDVMFIPLPKMDGNYGPQIGIPELEGVEGQHGGHVSALEASKVVFEDDQKKMDAAWDLNVYTQTDENHTIPMYGKADPGIPQWTPMFQTFKQELDLPQMYTGALKALNEYGPQYTATGASWDVKGTDKIRWTDMNETISQAIAGQVNVENLPGIIREKMLATLSNQN
jgi:hypothetical protein